MNTRLTKHAFMAGTLAISLCAWAEDPGVALEEVTVTARKRDESLQKIPDSVTALSAETIESADISSIDRAIDFVPNISYVATQDAGANLITVRGIGQVRLGEPPVAINVDGVQLTSTDQLTQVLFDLEQMEFLKGPQGALYGRNAIGGAINILTRKPTNDFQGKVRLKYANGDDKTVNASFSGPLVSDKLLFRVDGYYQDFGGVLENVTLNRKVDYKEDRVLRARLIAQPNDALTLDLRGSVGRLDGGASWYIPLPDGQPNNTSVPIQADEAGFNTRDNEDVSLKVDYELDAFTVTSISAHSSTDFDFFQDLDWQPLPLLSASQTRDTTAFTQEVRFTSPSDQPLRWTFGAFYLDGQRKINTSLLLGGRPFTELQVAGTTDDSRGTAGFGQINYDLTPALELTIALRYDEEKKTQLDRLGLAGRRSTPFDAWQPKFSLGYDLTPDVLTYVTFARGFRSGGFNAPNGSFPEIYDAELATSYEAGIKSTLAEGRVRLNAAAFYTEFDDQQLYILRTANQGIVNVNESTIKGLELEAQAQIVGGLRLVGSVGLLDTEVKDFDGTAAYRGNQVPLSYNWSYSLGAQYVHRLSWGALTSGFDYTGKGGQYWHIDNEDKQDPVHLVDARVSADFGKWTVTGFAENLFDKDFTEEFFASQFAGLLTDIRYPGTPRRYGLSVTYQF